MDYCIPPRVSFVTEYRRSERSKRPQRSGGWTDAAHFPYIGDGDDFYCCSRRRRSSLWPIWQGRSIRRPHPHQRCTAGPDYVGIHGGGAWSDSGFGLSHVARRTSSQPPCGRAHGGHSGESLLAGGESAAKSGSGYGASSARVQLAQSGIRRRQSLDDRVPHCVRRSLAARTASALWHPVWRLCWDRALITKGDCLGALTDYGCRLATVSGPLHDVRDNRRQPTAAAQMAGLGVEQRLANIVGPPTGPREYDLYGLRLETSVLYSRRGVPAHHASRLR